MESSELKSVTNQTENMSHQLGAVNPLLDQIPRKTHFRKKLFLISLISFTLLVSISIYAYFFVYLNPNYIFFRAVSHIPKVSSSKFEGMIYANYEKPENESLLQIPISFSSSFSGSFVQKPNASIQYETEITINAGDIHLSELEVRKLGSDMYILLKSLSDVGLIDNSKIVNQWVQFDITTIPSIYPTLRAFSFLTPNALTSTQLIFTLRDAPPVVITEELQPEEVEGNESYHYKYHIEKDNLISFIKMFEATQIHTTDKSSTALSDNLSSIDFEDGEVWISKDKTIITRFIMNFIRHGEDVDSPVLHVGIDIHLKNTGQPDMIERPINYKTIQEVFTDITSTLKIPSGISN